MLLRFCVWDFFSFLELGLDCNVFSSQDYLCCISQGLDCCIFIFICFHIFFNFFSTFIYFFGDRERQGMNGGGAEREGDTESETGSRL